MVPPIGTEVAGVNTRTGFMAAPATPPEVMEVKMICVNTPPDDMVIGPNNKGVLASFQASLL